MKIKKVKEQMAITPRLLRFTRNGIFWLSLRKRSLWQSIFVVALWFLLSALCFFSSISTAYAGVGRTGAHFLTIPSCARAIAMGNAYVAVGGDVYSMEYNPAGLSFVREGQLTASHLLYFKETNYTATGIAFKNFEGFGFGFRYRTFYVDDVQRDAVGTNLGELTVRDQGVALSMSYALIRGFSLGVTGEFVERKLHSITSKGNVFGFGAMYVFPGGNHSLGTAAQNIGKDMQFVRIEEPMPMMIRGGGSHGFLRDSENGNHAFVVNWEIQKFRDYKEITGSLGMEWRALSFFPIRVGGQLIQNRIQPSFGFGLSPKRIALDYSLLIKEDIGFVHGMSILFRFGRTK